MTELNEEQLKKWARLLDNAKFKSSNVGRASPVPTVWIRTSTRQNATMLRNEIDSGKIKTKGAQSYLILGPKCLRKLLPLVEPNIRRNYDIIKIVTEWMDLLNKNVGLRNKTEIQNNRECILNLKDGLISINSSNNSNTINSMPNHDLSVLRAELSIYDKVPKGVRTIFQTETINNIMKKIAIIDPTGPEAELLKETEDARYGDKH